MDILDLVDSRMNMHRTEGGKDYEIEALADEHVKLRERGSLCSSTSFSGSRMDT